MLKKFSLLFIFIFISFIGCSSDDDPVTPNNPATGPVLLADVSFDSVGSVGSSTRIVTVSSSSLNFTDRDSARISFYYSGVNNSVTTPMRIYYVINDTTNVYIYNNNLNPASTEQFVDVTIPSPRVNSTFYYRISTIISNPGFSYFKFRDLKIYKK